MPTPAAFRDAFEERVHAFANREHRRGEDVVFVLLCVAPKPYRSFARRVSFLAYHQSAPDPTSRGSCSGGASG